MDKDAKSEKEIIIDTLQGIKRKLKKTCKRAKDYSNDSQKIFYNLLDITNKANILLNKIQAVEYDKEHVVEFIREIYNSMDEVIEVLDGLRYDAKELLKLSIDISYDLLSIKKNFEEANKDGEEVDSEDNIDELYYDNE